jgi:DDB1- and CUL4-associated factor 13
MKIKTISRDEEEFTRENSTDHFKTHYSKDPTIHQFEKPREYIRAYNSAKMNKIFAKPFVGALDGHTDTPLCKKNFKN